MAKNIDVIRGGVSETLLLPLWGRAVESVKRKPLLVDAKAVEIIGRLNYDFSAMTRRLSAVSRLGWAARALVFDGVARTFLEKHPGGTIVNIGCGLDTTFERVDNGSVRWYDLDLPDVMRVRESLIGPHPRRTELAVSFLDEGWLDRLEGKDGLLFMAAGVLYYFHERLIKDFFLRIAERFPESEIVFDATANVSLANKAVVKRSALAAPLVWELKDPSLLETWDERLSLTEVIPMFRDVRGNLGLIDRLGAALSDGLKLQYAVRLAVHRPRGNRRAAD